MARLSLPNIESVVNASVGPGLVIRGLVDSSISGVEKAIAGNTAYGRMLGHMTATPTFTVAREWIDVTENLVTLNSTLKGSKQVRRVDVEMEIELAAIDNDTYMFMNPGQSESDWINSPHATLDTGAGNAAFSLVSLASGTAGNAITRVVTVPATAAAALSVSVSGSVITINTATAAAGVSSSTAKQVVAAINSHSQASLLVQAGHPSTSNGSGVVAAAASAPLAGGAAGTRIGSQFTDSAFVSDANYSSLAFVMESQRSRISSVTTLFDCLQTEDFSPAYGDDGNIEGTSATFMAHGSPANFDVVTGQFSPPYRHRKLDAVVA